jgi:4-hydroxy-tetrahydrodipicolinate synthase
MTMTTLQHRPPTIRLEGALALLLTPFQNGGAIDWSAYDAYVEWQAAQRPTGLFAVCGSSEMKWLSPEERIQLAARAVQRAGDLPVVATANLGPDPADHSAELARMADTGIAAAVLIPEASVSGDPARYRDYLLNLTEAAP